MSDEATAAELIFRLITDGRAEMVASTVFPLELSPNANIEKRSDSMQMLALAASLIDFLPPIRLRADEFERSG